MNSYDTIVIGGGLTGLILAHRLHGAGQKVALLEARESLGGRYRRQNQTAGPSAGYSATGLEFYPATNENLAILEWAKSMAPLPLHFEVHEHRPQIFDEGRWRPFAGFGNVEFLSVAELAHFSHTHEIVVEPGLEQFTRALVEQLPFAAHTMSEVTSLRGAEGKIRDVILNGEKVFSAERVIFTPHPALLNSLIEGETLTGKNRARLAKMASWTAVILELTHEPALAEDPSLRLFTHSAKEFEPVVGRVQGARSRWMTLVAPERESEHEFVGQCIRHIKRQLKRAWPLALEGPLQEKIYVQANAYGRQSLKAKEPYRFPEISNLYVVNHSLAAQPGELASIEVAMAMDANIKHCGPSGFMLTQDP